MNSVKFKYSFQDPMVKILTGLLVFLTLGCLIAGRNGNGSVYRVEIDAAFGGTNPGFTGLINEASVNEKAADALEALLKKDGRFDVIRSHASGTDATVAETAAKIAEDQPELVLSIHAGWNPDSKMSGTRVYTDLPGRPGQKESLKFAQEVQKAFTEENWDASLNYLYYHEGENGTWTVEVQPVSDEAKAPENPVTWTLFEKTDVPCVIAEQFFVSNQKDIDRWNNADGYELIAQKYYSALCSYFGIQQKTFEEEAEENS